MRWMSIVSLSSLLACSPVGAQPDAGDPSEDDSTTDVEPDDETTTDGGDTDSTTTGGFFPDMPDQGTGCLPGVADDCPDGEKCSAYVMEPGYCCVDTNACVPIIGDKQYGCGSGRAKKEAEQIAARESLNMLMKKEGNAKK